MKFKFILFLLLNLILFVNIGFSGCEEDVEDCGYSSEPQSTYPSTEYTNIPNGEIFGPPTELFLNSLNENPQKQAEYLSNIGIEITSNSNIEISSVNNGIITIQSQDGITTSFDSKNPYLQNSIILPSGEIELPNKKAKFSGEVEFTPNGDAILKTDSTYTPLDKKEEALGTISVSQTTLITAEKNNCESMTSCLVLNGKTLDVNKISEDNSIKVFSSDKKENGKYVEIIQGNIFQYNLADSAQFKLNIGKYVLNSKTSKSDYYLYAPNLEGNLNHYVISGNNINQDKIKALLISSKEDIANKINSVSIVETLKNLGFESTTLEERKQLYKIIYGKDAPKDSAKMNIALINFIKNKESNDATSNENPEDSGVSPELKITSGVGRESKKTTIIENNPSNEKLKEKLDTTIQNLKNIQIGNTNAYEYTINRCNQLNINPNLCISVIAQESVGNKDAVNTIGDTESVGLFQVEPKNANCNRKDPQCNIDHGTRLLKEHLTEFNGNEEKAIVKNNARRDALNPSKDCPGLLKYQCEIKPGGLIITQKHIKWVFGMKTQLEKKN